MHAVELSRATTVSLAPQPMVLVPVGSIEQHGPHLPLDTDTVIATEVATSAALQLRSQSVGVVVAPALAYGSSGEHQDFAGTTSIGTQVLRTTLVELTRSMHTWAGHVLFVNAHGGNVGALRHGIAQLVSEGHDVGWVPCATEEIDLHAGRTETSLMLHLRPWDVRLLLAEAGNTGSLHELLPAMRAGGVRAVSPNGVLGDPSGASAGEGKAILHAMAEQVVQAALKAVGVAGGSRP